MESPELPDQSGSPESIETALRRLAPAAISERGVRTLERTLDGLDSGLPALAKVNRNKAAGRSGWWTAAVVIPTAAAAGLAVALVMSKGEGIRPGPVVSNTVPELPTSEPARIMGARTSEPKPKSHGYEANVPGEIPTRDLRHDGKEVSINLPDGRIKLTITPAGDVFDITAPDGSAIFSGNIESEDFPADWKEKGVFLQRSLRHGAGKGTPAVLEGR